MSSSIRGDHTRADRRYTGSSTSSEDVHSIPQHHRTSSSRSSRQRDNQDRETTDGDGLNHPHPPEMTRGLSRGKTLGIRKSLPLSEKGQANGFSRFDYEQKYPEDLAGEEASEYARVWLTYLDETEQYDRDKIDGWKDTIDVLMVLAGLFSAVVTTLVVQSSQNLQTDYLQVSAFLLFESVQIQRAIATGVPVQSVPVSPINPTSQFKPSVTDSVVNGLWFTSLALALSTALLAVLTKQWLYQYTSLTFGTPRERCRLRQFRFQGLEIWKVALIIELLPVLIHIALALFLAGLVIFLIPLKLEVAWAIGVITGITYACYILSVLIPIWDPQCPYTIPLTIYLRDSWKSLRYGWHWLMDFGLSYETRGRKVYTIVIGDTAKLFKTLYPAAAPRLYKSCSDIFSNILRHSKKVKSLIKSRLRLRFQFSQTDLYLRSHREHEANVVRQNGSVVDAGAISWLYTVSSNPSVRRITTQAIGGLPYGINEHIWIEDRAVYQYIDEFSDLRDFSAPQVSTLRRLIQSWLHYESDEGDDFIWFPSTRKVRGYEPDFADLCNFLRSDPAGTLVECLQGNMQEVYRPLTVWSFLFRTAEHRSALAVALLTWAPGDNLFTWDDRRVVPVPGKEQLTLSETSIRHPHIFGRWVFNYLCKFFDVTMDKKHSRFIHLEKDYYIRYSLFKTIYHALSRPTLESEFSRWNSFLIKISLFYLVRNFETYVTAQELNLDDFGELCKAFEQDVIWSDAFFNDQAVVPQTRARAFQIYNILRMEHMSEPLHDKTVHCAYHHLVQADTPRWVPASESCQTALLLLSVLTLPKFCKFLCTLQDPELALVLSYAKQGFTPSHSEKFVSVYKIASRNPSSKLYHILYDPAVLEEICKCMSSPECSGYIYRIARLDPLNPNWKYCYRRLLMSIEAALETSMGHGREDIPPFYQAYRKEWFLLYSVCHRLRSILKIDLSGTEFALRELTNIFPEHSPDRINKLNDLLRQREAFSHRLSHVFDAFETRLIKTLYPANCSTDSNEKPEDTPEQDMV